MYSGIRIADVYGEGRVEPMVATKKVILAHPMQQHSYRTAQELEKQGVLSAYLTTVYYRPEKFIYRVLKSVLKQGLLSSMEQKQNEVLDSKVKTARTFWGLLYLFLIRYDRKRILLPSVYRILCNSFGRYVAKVCKKQKPDALIMFDSTASLAFQKIKKAEIPVQCILEMSSIPVADIRNILLQDKVSEKNFEVTAQNRLKTFSEINNKMGEKEIALADFIVPYSSFCAQLVQDKGVDADKIQTVTLGVDHEHFVPVERHIKGQDQPLVFLVVGSIEASKGTHHLLGAIQKIPDVPFVLRLIGDNKAHGFDLPAFDSRIEFVGNVPHARMPQEYGKADVFVTTSMYEGLPNSLLEAMATGLPAIASKHTIAVDLVRAEQEGFLVSPTDEQAIADAMKWFVEHKDQIPSMGLNSQKAVKNLTWQEYGKRLAQIITEDE